MSRDEWDQMSEDEKDRRLGHLISLERYVPTLEKIAKYEESKSVVASHWRGIIIMTASIVTAVIFLGTTFKSTLIRILGL